MAPRVSICIPTYEQVECLARTLDSVVLQDFRDYEVVITDDSGDDRVERLLEDYDFGDRLRYARNPQRLGSPANWNAAARLARGEFVKILHHDDWFSRSDSLGCFVAALESDPEAGLAFSGTRIVDARDESERFHFAGERELAALRRDPAELFFGNFVGSPSATIHRARAFVPFDEGLRWLVDVEHTIRVLAANPRFVYSDVALISTLEETPYRVTTECLADPAVDVAEHLALFDALQARGWLREPERNRAHLRRRVSEAGALSADDLRRAGYAGVVPPSIARQLRRQRLLDALLAGPARVTRRIARALRSRTSGRADDDAEIAP